MTHRCRTERLAVLTASGALAAAGALLPANAFAAPTAPHSGTATAVGAMAPDHDRHGDHGNDWGNCYVYHGWKICPVHHHHHHHHHGYDYDWSSYR